jgi:hypothetical protein
MMVKNPTMLQHFCSLLQSISGERISTTETHLLTKSEATLLAVHYTLIFAQFTLYDAGLFLHSFEDPKERNKLTLGSLKDRRPICFEQTAQDPIADMQQCLPISVCREDIDVDAKMAL